MRERVCRPRNYQYLGDADDIDSLPQDGKITFSATATDTTAAISNVIAELYQDGNPYTNSGLSNGGSGANYTGSFNLPANRHQHNQHLDSSHTNEQHGGQNNLRP